MTKLATCTIVGTCYLFRNGKSHELAGLTSMGTISKIRAMNSNFVGPDSSTWTNGDADFDGGCQPLISISILSHKSLSLTALVVPL